MKRRPFIVVALLAATLSCSRQKNASQDQTLDGGTLPVGVAFDVALTRRGAAVYWGGESEIQVQPLDVRGRRAGSPLRIESKANAAIEDVVASGTEHGQLVAWVTDDGQRASAWAAWQSGGELRGPTKILTAARGLPGRVAVTASRRGYHVFARGLDEQCPPGVASGEGRCGHFELFLTQGESDPPQARRVPLAVPESCRTGVVGIGAHEHTMFYGVCSRARGRNETTVYRIQHEPEYAEATEHLVGCEPTGLIQLGARALLVGACSSGRRAVLLEKSGALRLRLDRTEAACSNSGQLLLRRLGTRNTVLEIPVPAENLELVLPESLAPPGAHAVWTGDSLIVVPELKGEVRAQLYQCRDTRLIRES